MAWLCLVVGVILCVVGIVKWWVYRIKALAIQNAWSRGRISDKVRFRAERFARKSNLLTLTALIAGLALLAVGLLALP